MRIPSQVTKCVAFIGVARDENNPWAGLRYLGTAFIVALPDKDGTSTYLHMVTAKHVVDSLNGKPSYIRINTKDGACGLMDMRNPGWFFHPTDPTADVAVSPCELTAQCEAASLGPIFFLQPGSKEYHSIGVGDEVFITGLFANLTGTKRNLPIVRMGNIAMMPDEKVPTALGDIDAYLIEARSIGGLSGSPVFVRDSNLADRKFYLLGLMHGHWDLPPTSKNDVADIAVARSEVNMGIAIVVPSYKIWETLNHPALVADREAASREYADGKKTKPTDPA